MRTIIVSMIGLLAVVLAYNAFRPNYESTKTISQETVGEGKKAGGNAGKTTSPRSARQKASEADWAAVHAITAEYAPQLKELERERNRFKQGKKLPLDLDEDMANKAIRDLEREQWVRMSEYLSPYELREYKLEHSQLARDMRSELEWFQPSKGEFVALYTYREKQANLLDELFGGDRSLRSKACLSANERRMAIQKEVMAGGSTPELLEEGRQRMDALEGKDLDFWRASFELQAEVREALGDDRWRSIQLGPTAYGRKAKAAYDKLQRMKRLYSNGQITRAELELARHRSRLESSLRDMSEEEIEKEMKWYREVSMELPPATDQAADE